MTSRKRTTVSQRGRALTVVAAVLTGIFTWAVAGPAAGIRLAVHSGSDGHAQQVGVAQVAIVSLLAGVAACVVFAVFERFSRRARTVWTVTAATVLALSLTGPLSATGVAACVALACLHLLVGGVLIFGLRGAASPAKPTLK